MQELLKIIGLLYIEVTILRDLVEESTQPKDAENREKLVDQIRVLEESLSNLVVVYVEFRKIERGI